MAKSRDWFIGIVIAGTFVVFTTLTVLAVWGLSDSDGIGFSGFGKRVALVELIGPIESSHSIVRQLRRWGDDESIAAIVLRVDTPGGGVAASQEIYDEILRVRDEGKKVVVSMGSVAASGGLYVAVAADTVVANPGTLTGSIGVIFQYPTIERLLDKIGVQYETIKSGPYKDIGSFARSMSPADSAHLQSVIDDTYEQFVEVVADGRGLDPEEVRRFADGRIFTGRQALELNLVDVLGDYQDAIDIAAEMAGMEPSPRTVREVPRQRPTVWDFLGRLGSVLLEDADRYANDQEPLLQYRWDH
ncbi:MAG TPA: signal peptide peptidase SppA [Acidobacteriota bacterium]|nr:signal peptide peptidase SppA [Acidobacteriota bacterium]